MRHSFGEPFMSGACDHQDEPKERQGLVRNEHRANGQLALADTSLTGHQHNSGRTPAGYLPEAPGTQTHDEAGHPYRMTCFVHCGAKEN